jgi:hypothetical protein
VPGARGGTRRASSCGAPTRSGRTGARRAPRCPAPAARPLSGVGEAASAERFPPGPRERAKRPPSPRPRPRRNHGQRPAQPTWPTPHRRMVSSECPYGAYYAAAEGSLPAAVGVEPEPGEFPLAVLRVVRKYAPRGVTGCAAWQVQDEVVILGHCLLLCSLGGDAQAMSGNRRRARADHAGREQSGQHRGLQG